MRVAAACLAVMILCGCRSAAIAAPTAPEQYMQQLIENRYRDVHAAAPAVPPPVAVFDAALARLLHPDPASGETPLDFDPICNCQDFNISAVSSRRVASDGKLAVVEVRFVNGGNPVKLRYTLHRKGQQWQISDIDLPGQGSLVALLAAKPAQPARQ